MLRSWIRCLAWIAPILIVTACRPPDPRKIVRDIDLQAPSGAPRITAIEDLGSAPLIMNKPVPRATGDSVAVVGELLVIRGKNLGKQPQVMLGPNAVEILARTEDGGIVIRAPFVTTAGDLTLTVSHFKGAASHAVKLRRYGLAVIPGLPGLQVLEVGAGGVKLRPRHLEAAAPRFVELHPHGAVAYAVTGGASPKLLVIDLAAPQGPAIATTRLLGDHPALGLTVSAQAKMLAVVHEKAILLFDLDDPRDPLRYNPVRFPPGLLKAGVEDVKLSPDGKTLVVLASEKNALVLFDVSDPNRVRHTQFLPLLPDAKEPLVRGLHFTSEPEGQHPQVLWVATGDTPRSQLVGKHPPQLLKLGVQSAPDPTVLPKVTPIETLPLPGTDTPLTLSTTYAVAQITSASVLRNEPSKMNFFVSMIHPDLFLLDQHRLDTPTGLQQGAELLRRLGSFAHLLKADHRGQGTKFHEAAELPTSVAVTGDGRHVLAVTCRPEVSVDPPKVELPCGILTKPTDGGKETFSLLGKLPLAAFRPPFAFGLIRLQP